VQCWSKYIITGKHDQPGEIRKHSARISSGNVEHLKSRNIASLNRIEREEAAYTYLIGVRCCVRLQSRCKLLTSKNQPPRNSAFPASCFKLGGKPLLSGHYALNLGICPQLPGRNVLTAAEGPASLTYTLFTWVMHLLERSCL
jgi:hypothetical protein